MTRQQLDKTNFIRITFGKGGPSEHNDEFIVSRTEDTISTINIHNHNERQYDVKVDGEGSISLCDTHHWKIEPLTGKECLAYIARMHTEVYMKDVTEAERVLKRAQDFQVKYSSFEKMAKEKVEATEPSPVAS